MAQNVFRKSGNDPARGAGGDVMSERPTSYAPDPYHNNVVGTSEAGHSIELDGTPGHERVMVFHRSGSHIEMFPDGSVKIKSGNTRQDVTIGDHEIMVRGDYKISVSGNIKIRAIDGSIEIQGTGAALNVEGELKLHANNILMKATNKIALEAPFVDVGTTAAGKPIMSIPLGMANLMGVPIPTMSGFSVDPAAVAEAIAPFAAASVLPVVGAAVVPSLQQFIQFQTFANNPSAALSYIRSLPVSQTTQEPQLPEIDQPTEIPLSSPGIYNGSGADKIRFRERQLDTPEDVQDTTSYNAHLGIMSEMNDLGDTAKNLPGQVFASDTSTPADEPLPARVFKIDGVVSCVTGNVVITGVGTSFTTDVQPTQTVLINGVDVKVVSIPDDTTLIAASPWSGSPQTDVEIRVYKFRPFTEFFQKYQYTDDTPLGDSGFVVRDLMRDFIRPVVERLPEDTYPTVPPPTPTPDLPGDPGGKGSPDSVPSPNYPPSV